jgi:zinc/manganese transport system substrate-binding protein
MKRLFRVALALLGIGTVLTYSGAAAAADKIKVVATFSVIGDMVANVAGDLVDLTIIVGPDGDSEEYEPTAADVPKMANARILFMNGLNDDFEPWLDSLMKQSSFDGTKVIVSRGVKGLSAEDEHPIGGKPKAIMLDQHAWMNPRNGLTYVKNLKTPLITTQRHYTGPRVRENSGCCSSSRINASISGCNQRSGIVGIRS